MTVGVLDFEQRGVKLEFSASLFVVVVEYSSLATDDCAYTIPLLVSPLTETSSYKLSSLLVQTQ